MMCLGTIILLFALANAGANEPKPVSAKGATTAKVQVSAPKVTFVELGSVNCIPCKAMKEVMGKLEKKYPQDLRIIFYDVWSDAGRPAGERYGIRSIPTQVFLDSAGVEFFRHEGYFPLEEVEKILGTRKVAR